MKYLHRNEIKKGVYGELSKVLEELQEFEDAKEQECKILMLCELSDVLGAWSALPEEIRNYQLDIIDFITLEANKLGFTFNDLAIFSSITADGFQKT